MAAMSGSVTKCSACLDEVKSGDNGIRCSRGHRLCSNGCSRQYVDKVLEEPLLSIPMKCPTCKIKLDDDVTQRVMTSEQSDRYLCNVLNMQAADKNGGADDGEVFCMCPFCNYFEYRTAEDGDVMFVHCQEPSCQKTSCFVCKLSVDVENVDDVTFHIKCASMRQMKSEFERILLSGNTVSCPQCKLTGMKDYSCSHISCPNCKTDWCYVCGQSKEAVDPPQSKDSIYRHFECWEKNQKRCPMYLRLINRVNQDFAENDEQALEKFHECRSKLLLREFVENIGDEKFNDLIQHFESVRNCGYSPQDIRKAQGWRHSQFPKSDTRSLGAFYWIVLVLIAGLFAVLMSEKFKQ